MISLLLLLLQLCWKVLFAQRELIVSSSRDKDTLITQIDNHEAIIVMHLFICSSGRLPTQKRILSIKALNLKPFSEICLSAWRTLYNMSDRGKNRF